MSKPFTDKARKPHEWSADDLQNLHVECKKCDSVPIEVPLKKVLVCPKVFQVRDLRTKSKVGVTNPDHVGKLADRLDKEGELDPILVFPINANRYVIIDGTHRRAAYERKGRQTIPVKVFGGAVAEARVAAGRSDNAKKRLEWTSAEKSQYLYQLILERLSATGEARMTHKQCAAAADRTTRLAEHMERYIRRCKDNNRDVPEKWNGGAWVDSEETESAEDRMVREFGDKLAALGKLSPTKARALGAALARYTDHAAEVAKALVEEGDLHDEVFSDFSERIAEEVEEQTDTSLENIIAGAVARNYLSGLSAAMGAGF
ncbi:ParB N-terminal domain-containing protein [Paraburkholderia fungorum]|uniref:ParB N-terminal domain-containing protein n=1 Tax=Paraburkholderia fungorum TaxID=134537 RepID=UPI00209268B4|nr:ParB N-terminal domain-containing protein [Paraburkholderia fungorum]USU15359.1 ParB N-terminal domain-containing protein [Paraburkholderia fungorum]USU23304.1 ParB N-terminal domain-containing protein [Paraburkholderia fungorum]